LSDELFLPKLNPKSAKLLVRESEPALTDLDLVLLLSLLSLSLPLSLPSLTLLSFPCCCCSEVVVPLLGLLARARAVELLPLLESDSAAGDCFFESNLADERGEDALASEEGVARLFLLISLLLLSGKLSFFLCLCFFFFLSAL